MIQGVANMSNRKTGQRACRIKHTGKGKGFAFYFQYNEKPLESVKQGDDMTYYV